MFIYHHFDYYHYFIIRPFKVYGEAIRTGWMLSRNVSSECVHVIVQSKLDCMLRTSCVEEHFQTLHLRQRLLIRYFYLKGAHLQS